MPTVSVKVAPRVVATRSDQLASGIANDIAIDVPVTAVGAVNVAGVQTALDATKLWTRAISLSASTPVNLDLTALTSGQGDTAFADVTMLALINTEGATSGRTLTIGAEGSANEWYDPLGASGSKLIVPAGSTRLLYLPTAAGWTVATRKLLKLDPGANPCAVVVVIAGH